MFDEAREERILKLIEIWFYLKERGTVWPAVTGFLEEAINRRLKV
jgi:hypothetical protein